MTGLIGHDGALTSVLNRRNLLTGAVVAGTLAATAACGAKADPLGGASSGAPGSGAPKTQEIVVGSASFSESNVMAELYSQALVAKGVKSSTHNNIGSREVYIAALADGSISIVPEYTGNLLTYLDPKATATTEKEIESALPGLLAKKKLKMLGVSTAVDQDVYCVTAEFAQKHGLASLADLSKIASTSVLGGQPELKTRPYGPPGLEGIYHAKFKSFTPYDSEAVMLKDLLANKIQVVDFFTTEAVISENKLVQLADPQSMILPQNVIPVVTDEVAANTTAVDALNAIQKALSTDDLIALNKSVDAEKKDAKDVAAEWLKGKGLA